jgi:hypothetical protein
MYTQKMGGRGTKLFAGFALQFEAPEKVRSPSLKFSRQPALVAPKPWRRRAKKTSKISRFWFFPDD